MRIYIQGLGQKVVRSEDGFAKKMRKIIYIVYILKKKARMRTHPQEVQGKEKLENTCHEKTRQSGHH
jgi:hypothetical protein